MLEKYTISELVELQHVFDEVCERLAVVVTNYRTMSGDINLDCMTSYERQAYAKREIYARFREHLYAEIENRLDKIIAEVQNEENTKSN